MNKKTGVRRKLFITVLGKRGKLSEQLLSTFSAPSQVPSLGLKCFMTTVWVLAKLSAAAPKTETAGSGNSDSVGIQFSSGGQRLHSCHIWCVNTALGILI
jgi:hypothetical protein